jgi:hypothetical protein
MLSNGKKPMRDEHAKPANPNAYPKRTDNNQQSKSPTGAKRVENPPRVLAITY